MTTGRTITTSNALRHCGLVLPGLVVCLGVALAAQWLSHWSVLSQRGIGALVLAIVLGMISGNLMPSPWHAPLAAGVDLARQRLLRIGIVLYGFRLSWNALQSIGLQGLAVDLLMVSSTFAIAVVAGRRLLGLDRDTAWLIGAGSAICGAAAVMATAPLLQARSRAISTAVGSVVAFGTVSMLLYPVLWGWLEQTGVMPVDGRAFGLFTGATVHEVAQVVAAARSLEPAMGDAAVITKMVRVLLLAPFLILLTIWLSRGRQVGDTSAAAVRIPWFAVGFLAVVVVQSLINVPTSLANGLTRLDDLLLCMAMAGLGLTTSVAAIAKAGKRPMLLAALLWVWLVAGGLLITVLICAI